MSKSVRTMCKQKSGSYEIILNQNILIQVKGVAIVMLFGQSGSCFAGFYFPAVLECAAEG